MRRRRFALQPLLEQRVHAERLRGGELAHAQRARDAAFARCAEEERRYDDAGDAAARCAAQGRVVEARFYDATLRDAGSARLRCSAELEVHEAAVTGAVDALTLANRERRTFERLRERLEARRRSVHDDD